MLTVTEFDVSYVMEQAGHADPETTIRIYRHLQRRRQASSAAV